MNGISNPRNEIIDCPVCQKSKIDITIIPEYYSSHISRISAKSVRIPVYHPERIEIHTKCPNCNASKKEIKESLEKGISRLTHEERLRRLKEAGLPTQIGKL